MPFITVFQMSQLYRFILRVLWPLFHYALESVEYSEEDWKVYVDVNEKFGHAVKCLIHHDDIVWVHDYHLLVLPKLIRSIDERIRVGFFLHTPFPSSEVFRYLNILILRALPPRKEILESLLCSNLIGFHTFDYVRHFLSSCQHILQANVSPEYVDYCGCVTQVCVNPVGIEPDVFRVRRTRISSFTRNRKTMELISGKNQS